jgi:hypothetical protein
MSQCRRAGSMTPVLLLQATTALVSSLLWSAMMARAQPHPTAQGFVLLKFDLDPPQNCDSVGLATVATADECTAAARAFHHLATSSRPVTPATIAQVTGPGCSTFAHDFTRTRFNTIQAGTYLKTSVHDTFSIFCLNSPSTTPRVDCVGHYTNWTQCSTTCGDGRQRRTYIITTYAQGGGQECPSAPGSEFRRCNDRVCSFPPPPYSVENVRDSCNTGATQCLSPGCPHIVNGYVKLYEHGATCSSVDLVSVASTRQCQTALTGFNSRITNPSTGNCGTTVRTVGRTSGQYYEGCTATGRGPITGGSFNSASSGLGVSTYYSGTWTICRAPANAGCSSVWDGYSMAAVTTADGSPAILTQGIQFDVANVVCAPGYIGTPQTSTCVRPGEPYSVRGCHPVSDGFTRLRVDGASCVSEGLRPIEDAAQCLRAVNAFNRRTGVAEYTSVRVRQSQSGGCQGTTPGNTFGYAQFITVLVTNSAGTFRSQPSDGYYAFCQAVKLEASPAAPPTISPPPSPGGTPSGQTYSTSGGFTLLKYNIMPAQSCSSVGLQPVTDATECVRAAQAFSNGPVNPIQVASALHRPTGCYTTTQYYRSPQFNLVSTGATTSDVSKLSIFCRSVASSSQPTTQSFSARTDSSSIDRTPSQSADLEVSASTGAAVVVGVILLGLVGIRFIYQAWNRKHHQHHELKSTTGGAISDPSPSRPQLPGRPPVPHVPADGNEHARRLPERPPQDHHHTRP